MSETVTNQSVTQNGHEIENSRDVLSFDEFRRTVEDYGMGGESPSERLDSLKKAPKERVALFLSDLNRRVNGSEGTLVSESVMKVGDKSLIPPEKRYDLFSSIMDRIQDSSDDLSPDRVGDALALTTTMLHPFADGNGRTARLIGFMYREGFDGEEANDDFNVLATPRDVLRAKGEFMPNGYVPRLGDIDGSNPKEVGAYIDRVLEDGTDPNLYTGPYGQADLYKD